ncbi:hypothetical protein D3C73_1181900 [compost metagenome]
MIIGDNVSLPVRFLINHARAERRLVKLALCGIFFMVDNADDRRTDSRRRLHNAVIRIAAARLDVLNDSGQDGLVMGQLSGHEAEQQNRNNRADD